MFTLLLPLLLALSYSAFFEEKRFNPRAVFDDPDRQQPQNLTLLPGEETCDHIYFHVMVSFPPFGYSIIRVHYIVNHL